MAQHSLLTHPLVLRRVTVLRTHDITPRMRRITVGGPQLAAFTTEDGLPMPAFSTPSFDDHVKLVFATDGDIAAALPVQRARSIDWPPAEHRAGRDYTPRRFDVEAGELDLDVVLHGAGPAQDWARTAAPGDDLWFAGPKSSLVLPEDVTWLLLAGDETALPAIGRYLDERSLDAPVQVVVEIRDPAARQQLAVRDGDVVRWVLTPRGAPSRLTAAVQELEWWRGTPYVWVAGESRSLLPLRRWLRHDRQVPPDHADVTGYWHAEAIDDAPVQQGEQLLSPVPWATTRAALDSGVLSALSDVPVPVTALAAGLGLAAEGLAALVGQLVVDGLVARAPGGLVLGPLGEELLGEDHLRAELFGPGLAARTLDALRHLTESLRTGRAAWTIECGRSLATDLETDLVLAADRIAAAGSFAFVAGGVPDLDSWPVTGPIVVRGPGSAALLRAAAHRRPLPPVVVTGPPVPLGLLARELAGLPVEVSERPGRGALVVSALETGVRTDDELRALLLGLAELADRLLLVDVLALTGPGGPEAAAEHALRTFVGSGRGPRTADDLRAAAAAAGWRLLAHTPLGWDHDAFEFTR